METEQLEGVLEELDIEVESRVAELLRLSNSLCASLSDSFKVQLANLPRSIRTMTIAQFAAKNGGGLGQILLENTSQKQKELDTWVQSTPRVQLTTERRITRRMAAQTPVLAAKLEESLQTPLPGTYRKAKKHLIDTEVSDSSEDIATTKIKKVCGVLSLFYNADAEQKRKRSSHSR